MFISALDEDSGQVILLSRQDVRGDRLTSAHVQLMQDQAVAALKQHIAGVVNRTLELF